VRPALRPGLVCAGVLVASFGLTPHPGAAQTPSVEDAAWMAGCWVTGSGGDRVEELWLAPEGGLMIGLSRTFGGGEIRGHEFVRLQVVDERLVYWAYPSGQEPAEFTATVIASDLLRFENPQHDFPRAIEYRPLPPDSLLALVYGAVDSSDPAFGVRYGPGTCK